MLFKCYCGPVGKYLDHRLYELFAPRVFSSHKSASKHTFVKHYCLSTVLPTTWPWSRDSTGFGQALAAHIHLAAAGSSAAAQQVESLASQACYHPALIRLICFWGRRRIICISDTVFQNLKKEKEKKKQKKLFSGCKLRYFRIHAKKELCTNDNV